MQTPAFDLEALVVPMKGSGVPAHCGREVASENGNAKGSGPGRGFQDGEPWRSRQVAVRDDGLGGGAEIACHKHRHRTHRGSTVRSSWGQTNAFTLMVTGMLQSRSLHGYKMTTVAPAPGPQIHWEELLSRFPGIDSCPLAVSRAHAHLRSSCGEQGDRSWDWLGAGLSALSRGLGPSMHRACEGEDWFSRRS